MIKKFSIGLLVICSALFAQNRTSFAGRYNALDYAYGVRGTAPAALTVYTGTTSTGAGTLTLNLSYTQLSDGGVLYPLSLNAPITVGSGTTQETVTPTALNGCNYSSGYGGCTVTATFTYVHGTGENITSGSLGLQEAINAAAGASGGFAVVDGKWALAGGTTALVTGAFLSGPLTKPVVTIEDNRQLQVTYWGPRPTTKSLIAAGAALTLTGAAGGSLTTSGTYYVSYEYVDPLGGISLPGTDSAQITLSAQQTIITSVPVAPTGAVGWIPMITASAGGTGTEIEVPVTAAVCTVATSLVSTGKPVCALASAATITANPSATAKEVVESTAHTTFAPQPFSTLPPAFQTQYGPFVATATLSSSNADAAQFYTPAGYFNYLGKAWEICVKGASATAVASSVLAIKLQAAAQYGQSPVTISTITFGTQTRAAAGTFGGCWAIQTDTTGTSGKLWSVSPQGWYQALNTAPQTASTSIDVTTAASPAIDLTQGLYWSVNLAESAGDNITVPIINALSIIPINNN